MIQLASTEEQNTATGPLCLCHTAAPTPWQRALEWCAEMIYTVRRLKLAVTHRSRRNYKTENDQRCRGGNEAAEN